LDVPKIPFNPTGEFLPTETGEQLFVKDTYLFDERVRFVGDPVAAVAAESEEIAEEAIDAIRVDYDELPAVFDPFVSMKPKAPRIHSAERNIAGHHTISHGDVQKGFKEADRIFEDTFKTQRAQAVPLEPHVCVVKPDSDGNLTVWSSTQSIFVLRSRLAEALNYPKEKITVERPAYVGGGFGTKVEMHAEGICAILALRSGRPVKHEYTREEDFISTSRHPTKFHLKTGVKRDGRFTARWAEAVADTGAYARHTHVNAIMGTTFAGSYKCPNVYYNALAVYTNNPPSGSFRGFGGPQPVFAVESQLDIIANELGIDPIELRLRNALKVGDANPWTSKGLPIRSYGYEECMRKGAERIGWEREGYSKNWRESTVLRGPPPPPPAGPLKSGILRGVGMATLPIWVSGTTGIAYIPEFSGAIVKVRPDGFVELTTAVVDIGGGQTTVLAQLAAEELSLPINSLVVMESDTSNAPGDTATHASRVSFVVGSSVVAAARKAREILIEEAARILDVSRDELALENGEVFSKEDSTKRIRYGDVAAKAGRPIVGEARRFSPENNAVPCAAHFAEVEVDVDTGKARVVRYVAAHDVGRAIYPAGVEGQIEGGVMFGIEFALMSELIVDDETGKPVNRDLLDYKLATVKDIPKVESIIVETYDPVGPFGAKGIGEPPVIPAPATIANAIFNATGVRIRELPILPERLLRALRERKVTA
jgi:xanthine dehydrogenase molybdenum-binding subunit